jgi:hypothetical protein
MALTGYVSGQVIQSVPTKGVMKVDRFTADGTFTPPAGVTYAVAHIQAGGGGTGRASNGAGGTSSVAFAGGTISATGGAAGGNLSTYGNQITAGVANSGTGAFGSSSRDGSVEGNVTSKGGDGAYIVAGGAVTPGTGIAVTVGAGGVAGTSGAAGGSGYVWIEYLA